MRAVVVALVAERSVLTGYGRVRKHSAEQFSGAVAACRKNGIASPLAGVSARYGIVRAAGSYMFARGIGIDNRVVIGTRTCRYTCGQPCGVRRLAMVDLACPALPDVSL